MKKGFTLIELLAVVILLLVVFAIAVPPLIDLFDTSRGKTYDVAVKSIENAAKYYVSNNPELFTEEDSYVLSIETLCSEKYLTCPIYNPDTEEEMNGNVTITKIDDSFEYEYNE